MNRNEGLHSKLRVKLNRLVRRTRGYSKRLYMQVAGRLRRCGSGTVYANASACKEYLILRGADDLDAFMTE